MTERMAEDALGKVLMCDCVDSDSWVCFQDQHIIGMDHCPCPCHKDAERLEVEAREADNE